MTNSVAIYISYIRILYFSPELLPFKPSYSPESVHRSPGKMPQVLEWPHVAVAKYDMIEAVNLDFCVKTPEFQGGPRPQERDPWTVDAASIQR